MIRLKIFKCVSWVNSTVHLNNQPAVTKTHTSQVQAIHRTIQDGRYRLLLEAQTAPKIHWDLRIVSDDESETRILLSHIIRALFSKVVALTRNGNKIRNVGTLTHCRRPTGSVLRHKRSESRTKETTPALSSSLRLRPKRVKFVLCRSLGGWPAL